MKQFTLILVFLALSLPTLVAQADEQTQLYENAVQLALRSTQEGQPNAIYLDEMLIEEYFQALQAVRQSTLVEAYEVSQLYQVQCFPTYNPKQVKALVDGSAEWLADLEEGTKPARGTALRQLMDLYHLQAEVQYNNGFAELYLYSKIPINTIALSSEVSKIQGILLASTISPSGEGNDIEAKRLDNGAIRLAYKLRFDCHTNGWCQREHEWVFEYQYGQVTFVEENGPEVPAEYRANGGTAQNTSPGR